MRNISILLAGLAVIGIIIVYFVLHGFGGMVVVNTPKGVTQSTGQNGTQSSGSVVTGTASSTATSSTLTPVERKQSEQIGTSVQGRAINAYHYGAGDTELLFVGGIHGGYSWNTSAVAYQLMDYLAQNPDSIPQNLEVTVIPVLNPDGLYKIAGTDGRVSASDITLSEAQTIPGRFNGNNVDLNRNFDCDWQAQGVWQNQQVSGGVAAFSEPESQAMRDYVASHKSIKAVISWYSAAGGVFASNCHSGVLPETAALTDLYAQASGYKAYESFDFYSITGDMMNWLAKKGVPAISVLLTNHTDTEWDKNLAGVKAVLDRYKNQ